MATGRKRLCPASTLICQDRTRPRLVGIATAACRLDRGLTHADRLVRDAYGGAAEFYNDERDALRANQAHTEAKAVCLRC